MHAYIHRESETKETYHPNASRQADGRLELPSSVDQATAPYPIELRAEGLSLACRALEEEEEEEEEEEDDDDDEEEEEEEEEEVDGCQRRPWPKVYPALRPMLDPLGRSGPRERCSGGR
eukprot:5444383-Pyramimonas_sp.AAC.1